MNPTDPMGNPAGTRPLELTVHGLPDARLEDGQRTRRGRLKLLLVLLVCASPVIASYFTYFFIRPEGRTNYSTLIEPMRAMPQLELRTLEGARLPVQELLGQWQLIVLAPAACDEACEDRLFMQRQLREMAGRERDRLDKLWLVLDDAPIRPELLQALQSTPAMRIARADPSAVQAWLEPEAGRALQDHLYIVDPMGQWMMRAPVQPEPARLKKDIERLLKASVFWDQPAQPR